MSPALSINDVYESLIQSIGTLDGLSHSVQKCKSDLDSFSDYFIQKEREISKFKRITNELIEYLNGYDFEKSYQFGGMRDKLSQLLLLREKLARMGQEAKKIVNYPDYYGSKRAIEICRDLSSVCKEKLRLDEVKRVSQLVDENIEKLIGIHKKFEGDGYILLRINELVESEKNALRKYKLFYAELQRYIDGFPHQGEDNLSVVRNRIEVVKQMDALIGNVGKTIDEIKTYCERYNRGAVVNKYMSVENEIYGKMCVSNAEKYKSPLNNILKQAQEVINAFGNERNELVQLQASMMKKTPDVWKEDNERLTETITSLLGKDTKRTQFSLGDLKNNITNARKKRQSNIQTMTNKYSWLLNKKYSGFHDNLISKYISYAEYQSSIDYARKERNKKIWKGIGIGVGIPVAIVIAIYAIYVIIIIAIGWVILKVVFGSHD